VGLGGQALVISSSISSFCWRAISSFALRMMGTVYGVAHLQELFTGTFLLSFVVAPVFGGLASRIRLAVFLPWVYGFVALTMLLFYVLFQSDANDRWIAAAFFIWLSTVILLIVSVFWSLMADIFSSAQAKRLFGFIAAGGSLGNQRSGLHNPVRQCGRYKCPVVDIRRGLRDHCLSGASPEAEKRKLVAAMKRLRRPPLTTVWVAIRSTASRFCSVHAIF
jgi:hypothetical protein